MILPSIFVSTALLAPAFAQFLDPDFPNLTQEQIARVEKQAGGKLPELQLPTSLGPDSVTTFQLIAFNELFESHFFNSLLINVTENAVGYEFRKYDKKRLVKLLEAVLAQEELHAIGALSSLKTAGAFAPEPCEYIFPGNNLIDSFEVAETFTSVVLGALQGASETFSKDGYHQLVRLISSIIGQEGEQNGDYRAILNRVAAEKPFLTYVPAPFAWSALQGFVVPGSCPYDLSVINLPIFPPLALQGPPFEAIPARDQTLTFTVNAKDIDRSTLDGLYITYTTGQQLPISVTISDVKLEDDVFTFKAEFPYEENDMAGFSHAELTTERNFGSADDVVAAAVAGPALIQVK